MTSPILATAYLSTSCLAIFPYAASMKASCPSPFYAFITQRGAKELWTLKRDKSRRIRVISDIPLQHG